jgi:hypothetical protein
MVSHGLFFSFWLFVRFHFPDSMGAPTPSCLFCFFLMPTHLCKHQNWSQFILDYYSSYCWLKPVGLWFWIVAIIRITWRNFKAADAKLHFRPNKSEPERYFYTRKLFQRETVDRTWWLIRCEEWQRSQGWHPGMTSGAFSTLSPLCLHCVPSAASCFHAFICAYLAPMEDGS